MIGEVILNVIIRNKHIIMTDLQRYQLLQKLGEGTYGTVFQAIDTEDEDTVVAIKIMKDNNDVNLYCLLVKSCNVYNTTERTKDVGCGGGFERFQCSSNKIFVFHFYRFLEKELRYFLTWKFIDSNV